MSNTKRMTKVGVVVSDKMDKTAVVLVERQFKHPLYKKTVRKHKKFKAHDESNECQEGDRVMIEECRPISKDKCWKVTNVIEKRK
jgi:small subunit ribosomal protein S17